MSPEVTAKAEPGLLTTAEAFVRRLPVSTTLIKFLIVGGIAYVINQIALFLAYDSPVLWFLPAKDTHLDIGLFTHPDIRLFISSVLAVEVAIVFQFISHERWTFRHRPRKGWGLIRFLKFNLSAAGSPIIAVATINTLTPIFDISPYISNTIGILIGVTWNWTWNTLVIWPQHRQAEPPAP